MKAVNEWLRPVVVIAITGRSSSHLKVGRGNEKCRCFLYSSAMLLSEKAALGRPVKGASRRWKLPVLTVATSSHVDQMDSIQNVGCFTLDKCALSFGLATSLGLRGSWVKERLSDLSIDALLPIRKSGGRGASKRQGN